MPKKHFNIRVLLTISGTVNLEYVLFLKNIFLYVLYRGSATGLKLGGGGHGPPNSIGSGPPGLLYIKRKSWVRIPPRAKFVVFSHFTLLEWNVKNCFVKTNKTLKILIMYSREKSNYLYLENLLRTVINLRKCA